MPIVSLDDVIASAKQTLTYTKVTAQTTVAATWSSVFDRAGNPGAGTLAGTSITAGVVPTAATAGCPSINTFAVGARGYISNIDFGNSVACRMALFGMLFKAGAYAFNAAQALTAQPTFASRVSFNGGSPNYRGLQLWVEIVTVTTGALTVTVTYTNELGVTGRSTGAFATPAGAGASRLFQMPLQAGDSGVQQITNVTGTVATVGTFNVLILRPIWMGRVRSANDGGSHGLDLTGLAEVFVDSALMLAIAPDSTSSGSPDLTIEIAVK